MSTSTLVLTRHRLGRGGGDRPSPAPARAGVRVVMVGVAAALVQLVGVWIPSYWYDEAATLRAARLPSRELFEFLAQRDAVHGLYVGLMHGWIRVFGETELATRMPSVLATGVAAAGVFLLATGWGWGESSAVACAVAFTLMPRTLLQSVDARSYSLATAAVVVAAVLLQRSLTRPSTALRVAYLVVATLAVWCFLYAVLVLPALAVLAIWSRPAGRRDVARTLSWVMLPGLAAVPLVIGVMNQRDQVSWLAEEPVSLTSVLLEPYLAWALWLTVPGLALLWRGLRRGLLARSPAVVALLIWMVVPAGVLVIATVLVQPLFTPRYLSVCTPALALLCGRASGGLSRRGAVAVAVAATLAVAPLWVASRTVTAKPGSTDLRAVAEVFAQHGRPGEGFLLDANGVGALRPRTAIAAYPGAFRGLVDLAFWRPFVATATYWDDLRLPDSERLGEMARVWVAVRGASPYPALLTSVGFRERVVEQISGITVSVWSR